MKKIFLSVGLVALVGLIVWFGYSQVNPRQKDSAGSPNLYQEKVVIGYTYWPGYVGWFVATDKGYFKEAGLDVEMRAYDSFAELSADYVAGKIQGKENLTLDAVNEAIDGLNHRAVAAVDYSNGSDGIIAVNTINKFDQIKGKRIAYEYDTLEEFFLRYALSQNGMELSEIVGINLNAEQSAQALIDGKVDVAVTYEPFMSEALVKGGGNKIYSSADAPGLITDVITFRSEFIDQYPDTVEAILRAYFRAIQFWKDNPEEAAEITARRLDSTAEQIQSQWKGIKILDEEDNRTAFSFAAGLDSLYGNTRTIADFVRQSRTTAGAREIDTDELIDPSFIRKILK